MHRSWVVAGLLVGSIGIAACKGHHSSSPGAMTVTVVDAANGSPRANANVVLHDSAGQPIENAVTGSDGLVTFSRIAGGDAITVVASAGTAVYLRSVLAVMPGDALTIPMPGAATPLPSPSAVATPSVHFPTYAGAAGYAIQTGCSYSIVFSTAGNVAEVFPACVNASNAWDAVAIAGNVSAKPLAVSVLPDVPVSQGALSFGAWTTTFPTLQLTLSNPPAGVTSLQGAAAVRAHGGFFVTGDLISGTSGAGTFPVRLVPQIGTSTVLPLELRYATGTTADGVALWASGTATLTTSIALDWSASLLPRIKGVVATGTNPVSIAFDTTADANADAMQARVHWTDAGRTFEWVAYAPAQTASPLVLPTLPPALAGSVPAGTADAWFLRIAESDILDGYDDVRANYIQLLPTGTIVLNTPVTGSVVGIPLSQVPNAFHVTISEGDKP